MVTRFFADEEGRAVAVFNVWTLTLLKRLLCVVVACMAAQAYAQSEGPVFPDPGHPSMSRENQRELGLQAAGQVYKQMPVLPDSSPETQYIRQLGTKLVATIPPQYSWPFEFHVVAQKEINAFALPGGPMFVNIGTITAAANEAQLAGVMAHEMSHVYMQHSAKQAGKEQTTGMLAGLASAVLGGTVGNMAGGMVGQLGQMGIQMGAQGLMLKYSRTDESQADAVGAMIMYKAGYNPQAMADFFKTLEEQGGQTPPQWLSDHPNPGNRQEAIQKEIANWPPENYATDSPVFAKVRQHAIGVKSYSAQEIAQGAKSGQWAALNQRNGAAFNSTSGSVQPASASVPAASAAPHVSAVALQNVLPSQHMVLADLGPVKIDRPENWQVAMPQQQGQFVTIAPQAGVTHQGVGYGVLINGVAPPNGQRMSVDEITNALVQEMQQKNGLQPLSGAQKITVAGVEGRSVMFQSASPFPNASGQEQKEGDWLVTIPQRDGSVIFMVFVAPEPEFARFQPTYQAMLKSVQFR
ncbi:M48 family metallopeptidase [Alloacidobacterium sp.]|uniref:M48 family metallopeptidase n=1 Tax=Alloacidobacterium sp. TaxID=2951999 RepID=UPI002D6E26A3|nr:M48 family metallopeptidase [Alloacidobacterium sp.]HYK36313.1 M48 family metallopeptidase [Alloacidobacterium sp.]